MSHTTVLICDDNQAVHQTLRPHLEKAGFRALSVYNGAAVLDTIKKECIDLIILETVLPEISGADICRQIRSTSAVPIIFLSARANEADRISGLELGADDYVTKPFSPKEVITRVNAVLRRSIPNKKTNISLELGNLRVDPKAYDVSINNKPIRMTPREVELLTFLMDRAGQVASREEILNAVWGRDYYGDTRTVDTLLTRLRRKISEKTAAVTFRSIYGVGYMIEEYHG